MRTLDRYIVREFLILFVMCLMATGFLFVLMEFLQKTAREGFSLALMRYYLYLFPSILYQMLPLAALLGTLVTLTLFSRTQELVAMQAIGMGPLRLASLFLTTLLVITTTSFFLADFFIPPTAKKARLIYHREVKKQTDYAIFKTNRIWYRSPQGIYNVSLLHPEKNLIEGLTFYQFNDEFQLVQEIRAQQATYEKGHWIIRHGLITKFSADGFPIMKDFDEIPLAIQETPEDLKKLEKNIDALTFGQLRHYIKKNKKAGFETMRHEVNLHAKLSYPFAALLMALLGIPFVTRKPRRGSIALSLGVGLSLAFIYWICFNFGLSLGYSRHLPPWLAAWAANLLFAAGGICLLMKKGS